MAAALILLTAAVPVTAHHGDGPVYRNNAQCFDSENGFCLYAENCPNGGDCRNDCHLTCMKNAEEGHRQTTAFGRHMHGAHGHGRNR